MKAVNLYKLLQVERAASESEIRKAYYAMARKVHPDKNPGDESAAEAFRGLKRAYDVLRDPQRRARYDKAGTTGDDSYESAFQEAYERYKTVEITPEDIEEFVNGYKESASELEDLLEFAKRSKGDVSRILEAMIGSEDVDADRYVEQIEKAFADGKLSSKFKKKFEATRHHILHLDELEGEDLEDLDEDDDDKVDSDVDGSAEMSQSTTDLLALFAARREKRELGFEKFAQKWQAASENEQRRDGNKKTNKAYNRATKKQSTDAAQRCQSKKRKH